MQHCSDRTRRAAGSTQRSGKWQVDTSLYYATTLPLQTTSIIKWRRATVYPSSSTWTKKLWLVAIEIKVDRSSRLSNRPMTRTWCTQYTSSRALTSTRSLSASITCKVRFPKAFVQIKEDWTISWGTNLALSKSTMQIFSPTKPPKLLQTESSSRGQCKEEPKSKIWSKSIRTRWGPSRWRTTIMVC